MWFGIVDSYPILRVQIVDSNPDLKVHQTIIWYYTNTNRTLDHNKLIFMCLYFFHIVPLICQYKHATPNHPLYLALQYIKTAFVSKSLLICIILLGPTMPIHTHKLLIVLFTVCIPNDPTTTQLYCLPRHLMFLSSNESIG